MDTMNTWILTSSHWDKQAGLHATRLGEIPNMSTDACCLGPNQTPGGIDALVDEWSELVTNANLVTRYNAPARTVQRIREYSPEGEDACPYVIYGRSGNARALIAGEIKQVNRVSGVGPLARLMPPLVALEVFETATVMTPGSTPGQLATLVEAMAGSLLSSGAADILHLHNIEVNSPAAEVFGQPERFGARGFTEDRVRWWARLNNPDTGERILKPSKNARRHYNKLVRNFDGDAEFTTITTIDQVDEFATAAASIVTQTYQAAIGVGAKDTPAYRALLAEMAEAGSLRGYLITGRNEPIAYVLGDRWGHTFSLWALSFLPQYGHLSPGTVAVRKAMESLADEGVVDFDFGWGDAEYKRRYGDRLVDEIDFVCYSRRVGPSTEYGINRFLGAAKSTADKILTRLGIRDKIRKLLRSRQAS